MSLVRPDNIRIIAESLGIKVTDDAATGLAPDVEYRLREIIQVACQYFVPYCRASSKIVFGGIELQRFLLSPDWRIFIRAWR